MPWIYRKIPALHALAGYRPRDLAADSVAGLTVAAVAIPQAMAYAIAAGIPPQIGLWTAIAMTAVGALFDSSRQLINGPTNAISIAVFSALSHVPEPERAAAASTLALLVGAIQLAITALRLGDFTRYVSHSVIVGFTAGAAVLLVLGQLPAALGVPTGGSADQSFLVRFALTWLATPSPHGWTVALTAGTLAAIVGLQLVDRRLRPRLALPLPSYLIAMVLAAVVVWAWDLTSVGVATVGAVQAGLPAPRLPDLSWSLVRSLSGEALAIAMLGLLEAVAMAKALAARTKQRLDLNQQCLSEGLANSAGGLLGCMPGSGSLTRSAINQQAGAVSQWSGVISAAVVAAAVLGLGDLARYVPRAALSAILFVAAFRLVDRELLWHHLRTSRFDATIVAVTAVTAVAISVEFCLLAGVFISFVMFVPRAAVIHATELVATPDRLIRERAPDERPCAKIALFNLEGELFFGASPELERLLDDMLGRIDQGARVIVLRVREVRNADAVCIHLLDGFVREARARRAHVLVCGVRSELARYLRRSGVFDRIGPDNLFLERPVLYTGMTEALERAYKLLEEDRCAGCPARRGTAEPARRGWSYVI